MCIIQILFLVYHPPNRIFEVMSGNLEDNNQTTTTITNRL
jgi:hypothetical protein